MSGCGLILAAHGSRYEPAVNAQIRACAAAIAERKFFDEVGVAFHQGEPAFREAIDRLQSTEIVVVPVMTSSGYYSDLVLPRELRVNRRYTSVCVRQTIPLGMHPGIPEIVISRLDALARRYRLTLDDLAVAVVGHGTPKHPGSRSSTDLLVAALAEQGHFPQVFAAFIDEEPFVESVCELARGPHVAVVPFLIGAGPHAVADIPVRLGLHFDAKVHLPAVGTVKGRTILFDAPVGSDPRVVDLIVDLASSEDLRYRTPPSREAVA